MYCNCLCAWKQGVWWRRDSRLRDASPPSLRAPCSRTYWRGSFRVNFFRSRRNKFPKRWERFPLLLSTPRNFAETPSPLVFSNWSETRSMTFLLPECLLRCSCIVQIENDTLFVSLNFGNAAWMRPDHFAGSNLVRSVQQFIAK